MSSILDGQGRLVLVPVNLKRLIVTKLLKNSSWCHLIKKKHARFFNLQPDLATVG